ncbi:hypothetical protein ACTMM6_22720, partial [Escherichia coli]|uniref:hypothetical protein n=1 Tax=Escherichia coli TaxID=562 RepID=UPI003F8B3D61
LPKTCVFLGYNLIFFIFVHIDAYDDFQVRDWHVGQCKSGTWGAPKIQFTTQTYNIAKNTRNLRLGVHAYCSWTYLNGSPFGGFQQVYSDQNNVWYVSNYAWGNYESGGTISVTCLNLPGAGV